MTDHADPPIEPIDPFDEQLREDLHALGRAAGAPSPLPDRARADALPASTGPARSRLLATAAVVLVGLVLAAAVVILTRDDGEQQVNAGPTTSTSASTGTSLREPADRNTPAPSDETLLYCPVALLDLSRIEATPELVEIELEGRTFGPTAMSYVVTWEQGGQTVRLGYPVWSDGLLMARAQDVVTLPDGRTAVVDKGPNPVARVSPEAPKVGDTSDCTGFTVSISGVPDHPDEAAERQTALDVAEAVTVHPPPGTVEVPDVTGKTQVEAQDALARAGLVPAQPWVGAGDAARPVTAQSPAAGDEVPYGTEVSLALAPPPATTTAPPPPRVEVDALPLPTGPVICPISRLQIDGDFRSQPKVAYDSTIEWLEPGDFGGTNVHVSWPSWEHRDDESHGSRALEVQGRPALMHDGGDGQNLVFDTGLPGQCRFLQIGVYGGQLNAREPRATALAQSTTFAPPPTADPPTVTGLTVVAAADRLARAGFIPDWGVDRALGEAPAEVPTATVTAQELVEPGIVRLST